MPRTAAPITPGTEPTPSAEAAAPVTESKGAKAAPTNEQLQAQLAEMKALVSQLVRQQTTTLPTQVALPTMKEALAKGTPTSPVLTSEGWFVPAVLPSQRKTAD